ncbi:sensor domain-containing protein [Clostridiisalibacter paucivorans]|uniref:sensor domain-containing protein n=1 Tax=Clostridiisalibacter paucivorans TaxID=408753 RepID=UPI00047C4966|nr:bifunctional diguanylate cyclase/phosphodiesterase [Clostridiisalibacter paucivorans]
MKKGLNRSDKNNLYKTIKERDYINPKREGIKFIIIYAIMYMLLLFLLDTILNSLTFNKSVYEQIHGYKLWIYVFASLIILYPLIYNRISLFKKQIDKIYKGYEDLITNNYKLSYLEEKLKRQFAEVKKHRDALLVSKQRYDLITEGSDDGIWEWNIINDNYYFSPKGRCILGYQQGDLEHKFQTLEKLIHPKDKKGALNKINDYLKSGMGCTYENSYRLKCKNGEYKWILSRGKGIWDNAGNPLKLAGSHTDITEQLKLKERLQKEQLLSNNVINDVSVIVVIWDNDGRIKRINPYTERITGYTEDEVVGKIWIDKFIPKKDKYYMKKVFDTIRKGNILKNHESRILSKKDEILNVLWNSSVLEQKDGKVSEIISVGVNITEIKKLEKNLEKLAYYDDLTKLPNRIMIKKEIDRLINDKKEKSFALVYVDIDDFKHINDVLGHIIGDKFLIYVSNVLSKNVRYPDLISRTSGDEFIIVFREIRDRKEVINRLDKLINVLRRYWRLENQEFFVSYSIGIALYPEHGKDSITLLKNADTAMFSVKENGKDNFSFYSKKIQEKTLNYIDMVKQIRYGIDNNEFVLYYQPQIDLKMGKITGVEALIRWKHPTKGFVPPMDFIPVAEESGLIYDIGIWVFKTVCKQKKRWIQKGYNDLKIAINLSGKQLNRVGLIKDIEDIFTCKNIDDIKFELEITETAILSDMDLAVDLLNKIKTIGIDIALDDFGTGYSSLTYLRKINMDTVKMDREFIKDFENNEEDKIIVKSIIDMAHGLNIKVVAEGIETEEQLNILKEYGCDIGQGYLFSRAVPAEEIESLINAERIYERKM